MGPTFSVAGLGFSLKNFYEGPLPGFRSPIEWSFAIPCNIAVAIQTTDRSHGFLHCRPKCRALADNTAVNLLAIGIKSI
jgi:hypothetical protein